MSIKGLHHVQLAIPRGSEDAARDFFCQLLGMTEIPKPPVLAARGGLWVRSGTAELHLGVEDPFRPARKAHPGLLVDDLAALCDRLRGAGHTVEPDGLLPGFRRAYVHDPFGNRIELMEPEN